MCHVSRVTCFFFFFVFFLDKVVELIGGGSVINGATPSSLDAILAESWFIILIEIFPNRNIKEKP